MHVASGLFGSAMSSSKLEDKFLLYWKACSKDKLEREFRFHPHRKWRFDFAHVASRTAIEIQGGIWIKSGHSTGGGISRDAEKLNEAQFMGWTVFLLTDKMITLDNVERIRNYAKRHIHSI